MTEPKPWRTPEKLRCRRATRTAVSKGILVRPETCENCGVKPKPFKRGYCGLQAHHTDYSKPLEVRWLCFKCHRAETPRPYGDRAPAAKLTWEIVGQMRARYAAGEPYSRIAADIGVSETCALRVVTYRTWPLHALRSTPMTAEAEVDTKALRVKPLEWESDGPMQWAHGSCITYHIERVPPHPKSGYRYYAVSGKDVLGFFANVLDARDAAQADYETRILSAIEPPALSTLQVQSERVDHETYVRNLVLGPKTYDEAVKACDQIVCEEWNAFATTKGVTVSALVASILNRLRALRSPQ